MGATLIRKPLENKVTSPTYVSFGGISGATSATTSPPFPTTKSAWSCSWSRPGEGNELSQWVLKSNGNVVPRRTVRALQLDEIHSDTEKRKRDVFDALIERRWGSPMSTPNTDDTEMTTDAEENDINDDETTK